MLTRYSAWINGQGLQDIDDSICILDIAEKDPDTEIIRAERSMGGGTRYIRTNRHSLSVVIRFAVRERDPARRAEVVDRIRTWARGGWLTISSKPGKRLRVVCEYLPMVDSALRWSDTLELTLTAYDVPWWEDERVDSISATSALNSTNDWQMAICYLHNAGNTATPISVEVTAMGDIDTLRLYVDETNRMAFRELDMHTGDVFRLEYNDLGIASYTVNGVSVMDKRTGNSQDNVTLAPGRGYINIQWAEQPFSARAWVRGRWL